MEFRRNCIKSIYQYCNIGCPQSESELKNSPIYKQLEWHVPHPGPHQGVADAMETAGREMQKFRNKGKRSMGKPL